MLGAMLLLWMAMVSRPKGMTGYGGGPEFEVRLEHSAQVPEPGLAIRLRKDSQVYTLDQAFAQRWIIPRSDPADGLGGYRLEFTKGVEFGSEDRLLVYLNDLNGGDGDVPRFLEAAVDGVAKPPDKKTHFLTRTKPVLAVGLEEVSQLKSGSLVWFYPE
jgi:hypothetical protein